MKKASYFVPIMTIFVAITLFFAIIMLQFKANNVLDRPIGTDQFALFNAYQRAENAMDYLTLSAKYSMVDSVFVLANNSGYYGQSDCGRYGSFNNWGLDNRCYPSNIKNEYWPIFTWITNYTYLNQYLDGPADKKGKITTGLNMSLFFMPRAEDASLESKDGQTVLIAKQTHLTDVPRTSLLYIAYSDDKMAYNYTMEPSFKQSAEPDFLASLDYLKSRAKDMSALIPEYGPPMTEENNGQTYTWHNGGCVDDQAEKFYKFVEYYQDCIARDVTATPDGFGQQKALCNSYDLSQIGAGYSYIIRNTPNGVWIALKDSKADIKKYPNQEIWGTYVNTNGIILAYRYTCGAKPDRSDFGMADCGNQPSGACYDNLATSDANCGACGNVIPPESVYSCADGRPICDSSRKANAECSTGTVKSCEYQDGWKCCV